jgi:prophage regulatory protein
MSAFSAAVQQNNVRAAIPFLDIRQLAGGGSHPARNPDVSLYRLPQVLARIPVSRSAWYAGIQSGRYPRAYSLGPRTTVWRSDDIELLVQSLTGHGGAV